VEKRRVVVTGVGVVSALGSNAPEFWQSLAEGRCGIGPIEAVDASRLRFKSGAEVRQYDPRDHFSKAHADLLDRFAQFAVVAAREAFDDAHVSWVQQLRERTAVVTGCGLGGYACIDNAARDLYANGQKRVHPFTVPRVMGNAGASHISMEFGIRGPAFTISTACSSSNHAIGHAAWMVRHGLVDMAVAGGSEAPFSFGNLKSWEMLRVVAPESCRPFSKNRNGLVLGEGGAMLVLEPLQSALARDSCIYAEVCGFGMSSDAYHITEPSVDGAARAMQAALEDGDLRADQIGYVNAHGTGTNANDSTETKAIRKLLGSHAEHVAVSSTKSMHGHTLGAAGAIEAVATVFSLRHRILPPTVGYDEPDPDCDLDVVPNHPRQQRVNYALSNSFAFGGLNAVLAFGRWEG